ncbi:uncharacterized protein LOC116190017 isoform X1 [Punica granatum]|uniref:Uncharacterized protein LOC116189268 isoform X1 n=1 Tax=Punica granatum TaxID=22663 RepID=A0A218W2U0_PUNGR|nr:uncharacterized protein LOC116189268 isoform X1 [Punica granatum]XP_031375550.1 uncharacterized protein LOC116190017 isoform X1 [Punica granatum]OWM66863.1 hypothetical protein CDL15_Pgr002658 [Punica granatum]
MREESDSEALVMEPFELSYSDLVILSSTGPTDDPSSSASEEEILRWDSMRRSVMESLGPDGPGLLAVSGVPGVSFLRRRLQFAARELALLDPERRKRILKEQCLGSDVPLKDPDRRVSSFAMQLRYAEGVANSRSKANNELNRVASLENGDLNMNKSMKFQDDEYDHLGNSLKELGFVMMDLGICLARICDSAIGGHELEQSLMESSSAKGRLIHYHSRIENLVLKQSGKKSGINKGRVASKKNLKRDSMKRGDSTHCEAKACCVSSNLWQQWHYDYGIFTVLTAPMFLSSVLPQEAREDDRGAATCVQECPYPGGHTHLQILDAKKGKVFMVKTSSESFIIQVGESADILSKGKLRSTLHCVHRPPMHENLSRESFVLFLQPAWTKIFTLSGYPMDQLVFDCEDTESSNDGCRLTQQDGRDLIDRISRIIPSLMSRLKDGMSFAEFSRETTKQYYGGSGLQANQ